MYFGENNKTPTNAEEIAAVQKMKILSRPLKGTREESKYASGISKFSVICLPSVVWDHITEDDKKRLT